jgi:hypothetical protein
VRAPVNKADHLLDQDLDLNNHPDQVHDQDQEVHLDLIDEDKINHQEIEKDHPLTQEIEKEIEKINKKEDEDI